MSAQADDAIAVIVLAGGRSTRMGAHKLLLSLGGAPVIVQSARAALASGLRPVVVVTGHEGERVRAALASLEVAIAPNAEYHEGIAASLRVGIAALGPRVAGTVVSLGDQPLVPGAHLAALAARARATSAAIVATRYPDHDGNPIYFGRAVFAELARLQGDQGARSLLTSSSHAVAFVTLDDADAALDVDERADYERVRRVWQARGLGAGY